MAMNSGDDFDRDILDIIPERFDADADSRQARAGSRLRGYVSLGAAVLAVGGIVAVGLHFMGTKTPGGPGIPVIKADERPIKIRPDDRGGMQVPNQDKLVYERLEQGEADSKVERLLPAAEQPQVPAKAATALAPAPKAPTTPEVLRPPGPIAATAPAKPVEPVKVPPPAVAHTAPVPPAAAYAPVQNRPPPPPAVVSPPVPAAMPAAKAAPAGGDYLIQLGALRSAPDAEKEWGRIQRANADLLGTLKSDVVRVELGEKGVFWRLRAGPLSEQAARQLCGELKTRSQGCIIARK
jgi:cell division septation protein DedD